MRSSHAAALFIAALLRAPCVLAQVAPGPSGALPFDAPESWAMAYIASESLLVGNGPPAPTGGGSLTLGLEIDPLPGLTASQQTVGLGGTKKEDLNRLPVFARPRLTVGLPGDVSVTVGAVPPIQLAGIRPALYAVSVGRPLFSLRGATLGARLMGQLGGIDGDLTCPRTAAEAGTDPVANPYQCEAPSSDHLELRTASAELSGGYRFDSLRGLTPHLVVAGNYLDGKFMVNARYAGIVDRTVLTTNGFTFSAAAGFFMPFGEHLHASAQVFYSPLFVRRPPSSERTLDGLLNARLQVEWTFF